MLEEQGIPSSFSKLVVLFFFFLVFGGIVWLILSDGIYCLAMSTR